mmetsp:Transcript_55508/g.124063  ORF Transcript_55508/g.124063 Transcript_55508/m.124063 type:complete len:96 (-) Transcript_55508:91-378(-)
MVLCSHFSFQLEKGDNCFLVTNTGSAECRVQLFREKTYPAMVTDVVTVQPPWPAKCGPHRHPSSIALQHAVRSPNRAPSCWTPGPAAASDSPYSS